MKKAERARVICVLFMAAAAACADPAGVREAFPPGMSLYADNGTLRLYVDEKTAEIAVRDVRHNALWYSNPPEGMKDPAANALNRSLLSSQIVAEVYTPRDQRLVLDTRTHSVSRGSFTVTRIANGVRILYEMSNAALPGAGARESTVPKDDARVEQDLPSGVPGIRAAPLSRRDECRVVVPLEYRLDGSELCASVDCRGIINDAAYPLHSLELLRYFGAAGPTEEGYILVPDGSGALVHLNNGRRGSLPVSLPVYGDQEMEEQRERASPARQVYLPVFGMVRGTRAFFAVIEEGDAIATIRADVSGRLNSYNSVGAAFRVMEKGRVTIGSGERARSKLVFQEGMFPGRIRIRYAFLNGDQATYLGMADHLRGSLGIREPMPADTPVFNAQFIGAVSHPRSVLGMPARETRALTTYRQAVSILDRLLGRGVDAIRVRYTGWMEAGAGNQFVGAMRPSRKLGGAREFGLLADALRQREVDLLPEVSVGTAYRSGGGFSPRRDAERYLNQSPAMAFDFDPATFQRDASREPGYRVSPRLFPRLLSEAADFVGREGLRGIVISDLGDRVRADYRKGRKQDRQAVRALIAGSLKGMGTRLETIGTSGAGFAVLGSADQLYDLPFSSSLPGVCDESVPFVQLALRGYARFTGPPVNLSPDPREAFLRALETGGDLLFLWTFEESSVLKGTFSSSYYSTHYEEWLEPAARMYAEMKDLRARIGSSAIVRHVNAGRMVADVAFANGTRLIINYDRWPVRYRDRLIGGQEYLLLRPEVGGGS